MKNIKYKRLKLFRKDDQVTDLIISKLTGIVEIKENYQFADLLDSQLNKKTKDDELFQDRDYFKMIETYIEEEWSPLGFSFTFDDYYQLEEEEYSKNIISVDLDDCLIPWHLQHKGLNYIIKCTEINLKVIRRLLEEFDADLAIHSSWGCTWNKPNSISLFGDDLSKIRILFDVYFKGKIKLVDYSNDRITFLKELSKKSKVLALDDIDLNDLNSENLMYVQTLGKVDYSKLQEKVKKLFL